MAKLGVFVEGERKLPSSGVTKVACWRYAWASSGDRLGFAHLGQRGTTKIEKMRPRLLPCDHEKQTSGVGFLYSFYKASFSACTWFLVYPPCLRTKNDSGVVG